MRKTRWSLEQTTELKAMLEAGYTPSQILECLPGKTPAAINSKIHYMQRMDGKTPGTRLYVKRERNMEADPRRLTPAELEAAREAYCARLARSWL